ncbi:hypothetical protein BD779DRAFT_695121 [Infundibulicybe gibba]|nr:hypothetical protein BD779DRAFT_695121 [Infundibulicybe gibba]
MPIRAAALLLPEPNIYDLAFNVTLDRASLSRAQRRARQRRIAQGGIGVMSTTRRGYIVVRSRDSPDRDAAALEPTSDVQLDAQCLALSNTCSTGADHITSTPRELGERRHCRLHRVLEFHQMPHQRCVMRGTRMSLRAVLLSPVAYSNTKRKPF